MANNRSMSTILPGVGQGVGLDLALEIKSGTSLPAASIGNGITGSQIATGTITSGNILDGTIVTGDIAANTILSANVATNLIQYLAVPLSSANILGMNAAPVQLLPAVSAKAYVIHAIRFDMTTTATGYANGGTVVIQYHTGAAAIINTIAAAVVTAGAGTSTTVRVGKDVTAVVNDIVEITNGTAPFITGTGTATVHIWYSLV